MLMKAGGTWEAEILDKFVTKPPTYNSSQALPLKDAINNFETLGRKRFGRGRGL